MLWNILYYIYLLLANWPLFFKFIAKGLAVKEKNCTRPRKFFHRYRITYNMSNNNNINVGRSSQTLTIAVKTLYYRPRVVRLSKHVSTSGIYWSSLKYKNCHGRIKMYQRIISSCRGHFDPRIKMSPYQ